MIRLRIYHNMNMLPFVSMCRIIATYLNSFKLKLKSKGRTGREMKKSRNESLRPGFCFKVGNAALRHPGHRSAMSATFK